MKRMIFILSFLLVFPLSLTFATSPTSITLTYDIDKGNLHVDATHPSFNVDKSYVRLMNVYVNENQVFTKDYFFQNTPSDFFDDVPLQAQVGDVIKVDLFCSLGGEMPQKMTVTKTGGSSSNAS